MLHIGIVWANPYSRNLGVGALAYSTLAILQDICIENNIAAKFILIGNGGKTQDTISVNGIEIPVTNINGNDHQQWLRYCCGYRYRNEYRDGKDCWYALP